MIKLFALGITAGVVAAIVLACLGVITHDAAVYAAKMVFLACVPMEE